MLLHLLVGHIGQVGAVGRLGRVLRIDVEVGEKHGLGEGRLVVDPAAAITVGAGALERRENEIEWSRISFYLF